MKKLPAYLCALLLFLLPIKFGGLAVITDCGGFYPEFFSDWLWVTWPPHALAFFGSALLALTLFSAGAALPDRRTRIFAWAWTLLPALAALPGGIRGEGLILLGELSLLLGCGSVILSVLLLSRAAPENRDLFAAAVFFGGAAAALSGWYQQLVGLEEMRRFAAEQYAAGIRISEAIRLKLDDPRICGAMGSCNILASMLMLMFPLGWYLIPRWSERIAPPEKTRWLLAVLFAALTVPVLVLTRSRSALFCPLGAAALALLSHPALPRKARTAGVTLALTLLIGGTLFAVWLSKGGMDIHSAYQRSIRAASLGERADYLRTSAILCADHPLTGAGWGGFFRTHMRIKLSQVDESARDPHNIAASFAGQCGVLSGAAMLFVLILPLALLWKRRFTATLAGAVFWCGVLFTLHSLIDCDWQVPATVAAMGSLYACALADPPTEAAGSGSKAARAGMLLLGVVLILGGVWSSRHYLAGDAALSRLTDKIDPPTPETAAALAGYSVEELASEASALRPASAAIPMYLGDWYLRSGDLARAGEQYRRALELDPVRPAACFRLAIIALRRGDREEAVRLLGEARRLFPKSDDYTWENLLLNAGVSSSTTKTLP